MGEAILLKVSFLAFYIIIYTHTKMVVPGRGAEEATGVHNGASDGG